ncbi:putative membrane protein [Flavobacterium sp. 7E]|uniref:DUF1003 domain-containing protein n=1 Tax=unclassified Flavobacterium TaxID=196869 RepID=UPI00157098EF|nr:MULTISPECIES: DUF1003 domain-containing protein [unclassified Flavobacterium]MBE0391199.1 hypothetical protein [Flavobacterium sp. PL002]NRS90485.1 putative membrane protein [Flavobacterium sp. 7E]NRT16736.1 putative membrane protein [Flavobacterium sp. 28A]
MKLKTTFISGLSNKEFSISQRVLGTMIRNPIMALINKDYPDFNNAQSLSVGELNLYREKYIANFLQKEIGELSSLESDLVIDFNKEESLVSQVEDEVELRSYGQVIADKVADFGGSWRFISLFGFFIVIWILSNIYFLSNNGFDPYPFILLNLILSCVAAFQAPIIMMSQNRQEEKDRERGKKDYMINLKSELEIRLLHEKLDHLVMHQQEELIEIQKIQIEMMNDILSKINK